MAYTPVPDPTAEIAANAADFPDITPPQYPMLKLLQMLLTSKTHAFPGPIAEIAASAAIFPDIHVSQTPLLKLPLMLLTSQTHLSYC